MRHWHRPPGEAADAPNLEVFKVKLDGACHRHLFPMAGIPNKSQFLCIITKLRTKSTCKPDSKRIFICYNWEVRLCHLQMQWLCYHSFPSSVEKLTRKMLGFHPNTASTLKWRRANMTCSLLDTVTKKLDPGEKTRQHYYWWWHTQVFPSHISCPAYSTFAEKSTEWMPKTSPAAFIRQLRY